MPMYEVKCGDGSDVNCHGTVDVFIPVHGLSEKQLNEIVDNGSTTITEPQVEMSGIQLDADQKEELSTDKELLYEFPIDNICGACGSSESYDSEGNNVTSH